MQQRKFPAQKTFSNMSLMINRFNQIMKLSIQFVALKIERQFDIFFSVSAFDIVQITSKLCS